MTSVQECELHNQMNADLKASEIEESLIHSVPNHLSVHQNIKENIGNKYNDIILPSESVNEKRKRLVTAETRRDDFAIQMLASLVNASRQNGTLPNADMMAVEAIKYADALIKALTEK